MPEFTPNLAGNLNALLGSAKDPAGDRNLFAGINNRNTNDGLFSNELSRATERRRVDTDRQSGKDSPRQFDQSAKAADSSRSYDHTQQSSSAKEANNTERSSNDQQTSENSSAESDSKQASGKDTKSSENSEPAVANQHAQNSSNVTTGLGDALLDVEETLTQAATEVDAKVEESEKLNARSQSELQAQPVLDKLVATVKSESTSHQDNETLAAQSVENLTKVKQLASATTEAGISAVNKTTEGETVVVNASPQTLKPVAEQVAVSTTKNISDVQQAADTKPTLAATTVENSSANAKSNLSGDKEGAVNELLTVGDKLRVRATLTDAAQVSKNAELADKTVSSTELANRLHPSQLANRAAPTVQQTAEPAPTVVTSAQATLPDQLPAASTTIQASVLGIREGREARESQTTLVNANSTGLSQTQGASLLNRPVSTEALPLSQEASGLKAMDAEALAAEVNNSLLRAKNMQKVSMAQQAANQLAAASAQLSDSVQTNVTTQLTDSSPPIQSSPLTNTATPSRVDTMMAAANTAPLNVSLLSTSGSDSLANNVRWMVKEGVQMANINVTPSGMGPISVKVGIENDQMNVSIIAVQGGTRDALDAMLPKLRDQLMSQGHESVKVEISDGRSEQSRGQQQNASQERQSFDDTRSGFAESGQSEHNRRGDTDQQTQAVQGNDSGERVLSDAERDLAMQLQRLSSEPGSTSGAIRHGYDLYV